jgi:hypothetical protein
MPKIKDLTGKKYNMLTAIKFIRLSFRRGAVWLFRCDCGQEKEIYADVVKRGSVRDCGCRGRLGNDYIIGEKFGLLTAVKYDHSENGNRYYLYKCDCGNEIIAKVQLVSSGNKKSCGCLRKPMINTGERYNYLTAIRFGYTKNKQAYWLFKCDCGREKIIRAFAVKNEMIKSCGCMQKILHNKAISKHGESQTLLYARYNDMIQRCYNLKKHRYDCYGGRGIKVFEEWKKDFLAFKAWAIKNNYKDGLSLERIDVNGDYCPNNCKWIPLADQSFNKRNTVLLTYNGVSKPQAVWAKELGLSSNIIYHRLRAGWSIERALTTVKEKNNL